MMMSQKLNPWKTCRLKDSETCLTSRTSKTPYGH